MSPYMRPVCVRFVARLKSIQVGVPYLDDVLPSEQDPSLTWVVNVVGALARDFVGVLR